MKHLKKVLITLVVASTIIACKNEKEKQNSEPIENNADLSTEKPIAEDQKIGFQKTLSLQNITFEIKASGEGSIQQLSIQPEGLEIDNQKITLEIEGQVTNAEIEDLNSDGSPEILIYIVSAGSGSYGNVIGYSVNNRKSMSQIYFPDLFDNKEASSGYMGHDEFAIVETTLVRRFPVYNEGDTNNNPTGGLRQIGYKLKDGEASRVFEIGKIYDFDQ
ncbi:MAG: PliI family lysozyme inhibitor of I-type lysozyme [Lutimonas sp.]